MKRSASPAPRHASFGFSLIELMIALVLGLLLIAGALSIFLAAREAFRVTEDLSRVQESGRVAFDLLARDVREAGGNHCANAVRVANVVSGRDSPYWQNWANSFKGFDGSDAFTAPSFGFGGAASERVAATDALEVHSSEDLGMYVSEAMTSSQADFKVNAVPSDVKANDVLMVCDFRLVSLFKATGVGAASISHGVGASGNCSGGFSRDLSLLCKDDALIPAAAWHLYGANAVISRPRSIRWFIGNNDSGGTSLYRAVIYPGGIQPGADEVAEGVTGMALTYISEGETGYRAAAGVADWSKVKAVRVELTLQSQRKVGVDHQPLNRTVSTVLALRNRNL